LGQEIQRVLAQQQLVREEEILKRQTGRNPGTQSKGPKAETPRRPGCHVFRAQIERRTENMARIKTTPLGRRVMALFLATIMCVSLVQISAFATETQTMNGYFTPDDAKKTVTTNTQPSDETNPDGTRSTSGGNVKVSKTLKQDSLKENQFTVNLSVKTTQKLDAKPSNPDAAVVLVLDRSGSMDWCANCGGHDENNHAQTYKYDGTTYCSYCYKAYQSRLAVEQTGAKDFIDKLRNDTPKNSDGTYAAHRYVSIVSFATKASLDCDWADVTTAEGLKSVTAAINGLNAGGGTYLQDGLALAKDQLAKTDTPANISALSNKFTVLLTDGVPTSSQNHGNGKKCSKDICDETRTTANALTASGSKLYSICYGADTDACYNTSDTRCKNCKKAEADHVSGTIDVCQNCGEPSEDHESVGVCKCGKDMDAHYTDSNGNYYDSRTWVNGYWKNWKWHDGYWKYTYAEQVSTRLRCNNWFKTTYKATMVSNLCPDKSGHTYEEEKIPYTAGDFLKSISSSYYPANNATEVNTSFGSISHLIGLLTEAWKVTDPMGDFINFGEVTSIQNSKAASFDKDRKTLTWDVKSDTPTSTETPEDGKTVYTYSLSYSITLDTAAQGFEESAKNSDGSETAKYYPTNGYTALSYLFYNQDGQITDESGKVLKDQDAAALSTIGFNVPGVCGKIPTVNYSIEFYKKDKTTKPAEYTLADTESGKTGKLNSIINLAPDVYKDKYASDNYGYDATADNKLSITLQKDADKNVLKLYYAPDSSSVTVNNYYKVDVTDKDNQKIPGSYTKDETGYEGTFTNTVDSLFVNDSYSAPLSTTLGEHTYQVDYATDGANKKLNSSSPTIKVAKKAEDNVINIYYTRTEDQRDAATVQVNRVYTTYTWKLVDGKYRAVAGTPVTISDPEVSGKLAFDSYTVSLNAPANQEGFQLHGVPTADCALSTETTIPGGTKQVVATLHSGENTITIPYAKYVGEPETATINVTHHYTYQETTVNEDGTVVTIPHTGKSSNSVSNAHVGDSLSAYSDVVKEITTYDGSSYTSDESNATTLAGTVTAPDMQVNLYYSRASAPEGTGVTVNYFWRTMTTVTKTQYDADGKATGTYQETETNTDHKESVSFPNDSDSAMLYKGQKFAAKDITWANHGGYTRNDTDSTPNLTIAHLDADRASNVINVYYDKSAEADSRDDAQLTIRHTFKTNVKKVVDGKVQIVTETTGYTEETPKDLKAGTEYTAAAKINPTYKDQAYQLVSGQTNSRTVTLQKGINATIEFIYERNTEDLTDAAVSVKYVYNTYQMYINKDGKAVYPAKPESKTEDGSIQETDPLYVGMSVTLKTGEKAGFEAASTNPAIQQTLTGSKNEYTFVYSKYVPLEQVNVLVNHHYTTINEVGVPSTNDVSGTSYPMYKGEKFTAAGDTLNTFTQKYFTLNDDSTQHKEDTCTVDKLTGDVTVDFYYVRDDSVPAYYTIKHIYHTIDQNGKDTVTESDGREVQSWAGLSASGTPNCVADSEGHDQFILTKATATNGFSNEDAYEIKLVKGHDNVITFEYKRNVDTRKAANVIVNHHYSVTDTYTNTTKDEGTVTETFASYKDQKLDFDGTKIYVGAEFAAVPQYTHNNNTYAISKSTPDGYKLTIAENAYSDDSKTVQTNNIIDIYYVRTVSSAPVVNPPSGGNDNPGTVITDPTTPTTDIPSTETPTTDIPDVETPTTEKPTKPTKPTTEIPDDKTPLANTPKTGDALAAWLTAAVASGAGLAWLAISAKKRKEDSAQ
jgi:Mg-chelatase subunit ChlD